MAWLQQGQSWYCFSAIVSIAFQTLHKVMIFISLIQEVRLFSDFYLWLWFCSSRRTSTQSCSRQPMAVGYRHHEPVKIFLVPEVSSFTEERTATKYCGWTGCESSSRSGMTHDSYISKLTLTLSWGPRLSRFSQYGTDCNRLESSGECWEWVGSDRK